MKRTIINWKLGISAGLLLFMQNAGAIEFVQRDQFVSGEAETLRDELWISAGTITLSGQALDDVFAAGGILDLRGAFHGDVWACGEQLIAAGHFNDHTRFMANTVQVSGTLDGSLAAIGKTVKLDSTATLAKNALCLGENLISEGTISGDLRMIGQKVTLGGKIDGKVTIAAQEIVVLPGTVIGGDLNYTAPQELVLFPSVTLQGKLNRVFENPPPVPLHKPLGSHFLFAVAALCAGLVFSAVFFDYTARAVTLLKTARTTCFFTGLAALFLIPAVAVIMLFTVVGITLSLLLFLFYFTLLALSNVIVGFWLGTLLLHRKELLRNKRGSTLAAGLLVLYTLTAFTAISATVHLLIAIFGLGALLLALFKKPVLIIKTLETNN